MLLSSWWLFPLIFEIRNFSSGVSGYSITADLINLNNSSINANFFNIVSLRYFPISNAFAVWSTAYIHNIVFAYVFPILVTILISIGFFSGIINKGRNYGSYLNPIIYSYIILFFGLMGTNAENPFSWLYSSIFLNYFWSQPVLRGPYLSFGVAFAFASSVLFAVGGIWIIERCFFSNKPIHFFTRLFSGFHYKINSKMLQVIGVCILLLIPITYDAPVANGSNVNQLYYQASDYIPASFVNLSNFLQENANNKTTVVLPGQFGVIDEKWGYLGPEILQDASVTSIFQDMIPPVGSPDSPMYSMIGALPSFSTNTNYAKLLQLIGASYLIVDNYSQYSSFSPPFNLTNIQYTVNSQGDLTLVNTFGGYRVYSVGEPNKLISSYDRAISTSQVFACDYNLSLQYGKLASETNNNTGIFQSDLSVTNVSNTSFNVSGVFFNNSSTGKYPGWPEITNLQALRLPIGVYSTINVSVKTNSYLRPIISFSGNKSIYVYNSSFVRTIAQFVSTQQISESFNNSTGTWNFTFYLGTSSLLNSANQRFLNHIMIELQPVNGYFGPINATISIHAGTPLLFTSKFNVFDTQLVPNNIFSQYKDILDNLRPAILSYYASNPTSYLISLKPTSSPSYTIISLLRTFSNEWTISSGKNINVLAHFAVDGFMNGWLVRLNSTNTINLNIDFQPQSLSDLSSAITEISVIAISVILIMPSVLNKGRKKRTNSR